MPLDYGTLSGLAVVNDVDSRINDVRHHDIVMQQQKQLSEAKSKLFADSLDYQNAQNEFDNTRVKQFAKQKIYEIGQYVRENSDWKYNPDKLVVLNQMRRELKDNPDLLRGVASDTAFKQLNADLAEVAKNPSQHNQKAYNDLLAQKNNYLKYGNQFGLEAAEKEGLRPFVYQKPSEFIDLSKTGQELGNKFQDIKVETLKNGRSGAWQTKANEATLDKQAEAFYLEHKEQFDQQHPGQGIQAAKEFIKSGVPYKFDWGDNHFAEQVALLRMQTDNEIKKIQAKNAGKGGEGYDYFKETIQNKKIGADAPERLDATFGSKPKHIITNDDGSVKIDNTGDLFNYNGDFQDVGGGVKRLSGYVIKPLDWAKQQGVINDKTHWYNGKDRVADSGDKLLEGTDYSDYVIDGSWSQKASIIDLPVGKDGKVARGVKIKVYTDVDANSPAYQGKYNSLVATTEQRTSAVPAKTWNGIPVGTVGMYEGKKVQITENGAVPIE
jgi:hypothetical protein